MLIKKDLANQIFCSKNEKNVGAKSVGKKIGSGRLLVFSNIWVKKILREKKLVSN